MAAPNYFKAIRKSFCVHVLFTSVLSNLIVVGEPLQQLLVKRYAEKPIHSSALYKTPVIKTPAALPEEDSSKSRFIEQETPAEELLQPEASTVFYARETQGVIGKLFESNGENPMDNFFTIDLPETINLEKYDAFLMYDLYGLSGASHTTKSINRNISYGGQAVILTDSWNTVEENISIEHLRPGKNEIFFNRRIEEAYQYQIRNIRISLKEKQNREVHFSETAFVNYAGEVYVTGFVTNPDIQTISIAGQSVAVTHGVFDHILTAIPESAKELTVSFETGEQGQPKTFDYPVRYTDGAKAMQFVGQSVNNIRTIYRQSDLQECVSYEALSITGAPEALTLNNTLAVEGLMFKDVRTLNEDIKNVTAGDYYGYRINTLAVADSVGVELRLKYDSHKIPAGYTAKDIRTFYYDQQQRSWKVLDSGELDSENEEIVSWVSANETDYINGIIKVPESPETGSFAPTMMTDMKYADPTVGVVNISPPSPNNTGTVSTSFPIKLPQGRNGMQPQLEVTYNSEAGNGWMGIGWNLSSPAITLNTKWGVPFFNTNYETEIYTMNGADLVLKHSGQYTNPHRTDSINRETGREFYLRKEGSYQKIIRHGSNPANYWWEVTDRQGNKTFYGGLPSSGVVQNAVIRTTTEYIAHWAVTRMQDPFGNYVEYTYHNPVSPSVTIGGVGAREFYLSSVKYTLKSGVSNYYQVDFIRDTDREDVIINNRNGYMQLIKDLLTEIKVSFKNSSGLNPIRSYRFEYETTAFGKNQLTKISEYDATEKLFYSNTMEYYKDTEENAIINTSETTWSASGNDEINSPLHTLNGVSSNLVPVGSLLGSSVAKGFSFGLRPGAGIGYNPKNIKGTVGGHVSYSSNNQDTRISFIDINGDGLPDKVYKNNNGVSYRPNTGSGFGSLNSIQGINKLSTTKSRTFGYGFDVSFSLLGGGKSWSKTKSDTDGYFADFNGDGLPDIVYNNRVRFNASANGISNNRNFILGASTTENPVIPGGVDPAIIPDLNLPTENEVREQHSQYDYVKVWRAPYSGTVDITSPSGVYLVNASTECPENKFRLRVEKANNGQTQGYTTKIDSRALISSTSYNIANIPIEKGDLLFFRVHNEQYGCGGEVEWNPRITYTSVTSTDLSQESLSAKDENGQDLFIFDAKDDYIMNNGGMAEVIGTNAGPPYSSIGFNFNFPATTNVFTPSLSDDVRFVIKRVRKDNSGEVILEDSKLATYNRNSNSITFTNGSTGNFTLTPPNTTDEFYAYIESDSNVDWQRIEWQPMLTKSGITTYPGVTRNIYDNNVNQSKYWIEGSSITPAPVISGDGSAPYTTIRHTLFEEDVLSQELLEDAWESASALQENSVPVIKISWVIKTEINEVITNVIRKTFYAHILAEPTNLPFGPEYVYGVVFTQTTDIQSTEISTIESYFKYNFNKQQIKDIIDGEGRIYSAFYIDEAEFGTGGNNKNAASIIIEPYNNSNPNAIFMKMKWPFMAINPQFYGITYKGWGQFLYNGGVEFERDSEGEITNQNNFTDFGADTDTNTNSKGNTSLISIAALPFDAPPGNYDEIDEDVDPDDIEGGPSAVRYALYTQDNLNSRYINKSIINSLDAVTEDPIYAGYGFNQNNKLTSLLGRFGESNIYDVYVAPEDIIMGGSEDFVAVKQYSESSGKAKTGNLDLGVGSFSGTWSESDSRVLNQYIDLNGDRYPDIVTKSKIQYTNMRGGLSVTYNNDFISGDKNEDRTIGVTLAVTKPNSTETSGSSSTKNKTFTNVNAGINDSNGETFDSYQWVDLNGDGLPDKVKVESNSIKVSLNLGYGFSDFISWGSGYSDLISSKRANTSFGLSGGGSSMPPGEQTGSLSSFALGLGGAQSIANMVTIFSDINGDGLPDLIIRYGGPINYEYRYFLNKGDGFSSGNYSLYSGNMEQDTSVSGNFFGAVTGGFVFTVLGIPIKVTVTGSGSVNAGFNQKKITFQDINGDGLPDVLSAKSTNSSVGARLNKVGKTHLLKQVNMATGGFWRVDYARVGNTYDLPNSKWVLSSVYTYDGFQYDNEFKPDETYATVSYEDPKYDRRERDFLGFGKVTVSDMDVTTLETYRKSEQLYHNENIYLSGALKESRLLGADNQILTREETLYNLLNPDAPVVNFAANADNHYLQASLVSNAASLLDKSRLFVAVARVTSTSFEEGSSLSAVKEFTQYNAKGNILTFTDPGTGGEDAYKTQIEYYASVSGVANSENNFPKKVTVRKAIGNQILRERSAEYYSGTGKLKKVTTKLNTSESNNVSFEYDTYGNLKKIIHLDNITLGSSYFQEIRYEGILHTYPEEFENAFGETSSMEYEYLFGTPVMTTDMNGQSMRTRIDTRGRIVEVTGPNELAENPSLWTIRMQYKGESDNPTLVSGNNYMYAVTSSGNTFEAVDSGSTNTSDNQHYAITRHYEPGNQLLTISISDGFGQPIQVKKTHVSGNNNTLKWLVSGFEEKDSFGRVLKSYLPTAQNSYMGQGNYNPTAAHREYYNPGASSLDTPVEMTYDERDRMLSVKQPDESNEATITYSIEDGMFVQEVTNELSQLQKTYTDIRGRQRKTVHNEITTQFKYNAINELVKVINHNNFQTNYIYDLAGRNIEIQHPDKGVVRFKYDKAGRMIEQTNSNLLLSGGQKILYEYDFGRLVKVTYPQNPQNEVKYTYGKTSDPLAVTENAIGRLLMQEDISGVQVFGYGRMGEVTKNLRSVAVAGYHSYWFFTEWKYDSWNRIREIIYPDQEKVTYHYNKAGMLKRVSSEILGNNLQDVVSSITYNDYGEREEILYGNDTKTSYTYDSRRRMNTLSHNFTNFVLQKEYEYDPLSNIIGITTLQPQNSLPPQGHIGGIINHSYTYDEYNRLEEAKGDYTGAGDLTTPYVQHSYELTMKYNNDHTIKSKTQIHRQGLVNNYGDPVNNEVPVYKTSYDLSYEDYGTGQFTVAGNQEYGYLQPHAPRKIVEYPSWVTVDEDDPRVREKMIEYDANGNQLEIKEKVGEEVISLRKNLWDEENRLMAVDLKPDDTTTHPVAVYTYSAQGERVVRYNYDRIDVFSNANKVGQEGKDNVMIYPSGLVMAKVLELTNDPKDFHISYTKHYYIGSERISAKTGTCVNIGYYPQGYLATKMPNLDANLVRTSSDDKVDKAENNINYVHEKFGLNPPALSSTQDYVEESSSFNHMRNELDYFYFHPDHLGSSSYITNAAGTVSQHMEYLPFGELLVDEHTNSYNSPFKYNGKELDEETGNYYYSARYYDPKWSIFISVDPLADADKNIGYSPYVYAINNPITYTDPDGRCWQKVGDSYVPCDDASVGSTTTGAFGHSWTMTKNDGWQLTNGADPSTVNYEYDAVPASGNASYYEDRYKNHIEKYNTRPPDYYLGYGHKYINRFKNETRDKLTGLGKEWLDETAVALQQMMNQGISANPSIQGNNDAFQGFAYGTHVPAYSGSGKIGLLKGNDLWHIMWTPDIKDSFLSKDGVKQIMGMFPHILKSPRNPDLWDHEKNPGLLKPWEPKW